MSFRRFDGAPEPVYNRGLEDFDVSVTRLFAQSREGQIVLVETFGGKRHYYFYVSPSVNANATLQELQSRFPGNKLEVMTKVDSEWGFIRRYTREVIDEA